MARPLSPALAPRIEEVHTWRGIEYACAQSRLHPDWPVTVEHLSDGYLLFVHPSSPVNGTRGLGMQKQVSPQDMDRLERFFRRRQTVPRIDTCPFADPSVRTHLKERGYTPGQVLAVLYLEVGETREAPALPYGVAITRASSDQAGLWIRTTAQGFESTVEPSVATLDLLAGNFYAANSVPFWPPF